MRIELRQRQKHRFFSESQSFHISARMILYISYFRYHWIKNFAQTTHHFLPALIITKYFKKYFFKDGHRCMYFFECSPTVPLLVITISTPAVNVLWGYFFSDPKKNTLVFSLFISELSYKQNVCTYNYLQNISILDPLLQSLNSRFIRLGSI